MREKIIIFVILLSNYSLSQDVYVPSEGCPINTISTHPESYQNSSDPDNSQLWDWRTETFKFSGEYDVTENKRKSKTFESYNTIGSKVKKR